MTHHTNELLHHHFSWKDVKLSELSELYISMMIKTLGLSLIGIFVPVYFYQIGYSVPEISLFYMVIYLIRIPTDIIIAKVIGLFGPKHIMILSHLFLILYLALILTVESMGWSLYWISLANALSYGMFFMAYHIEFSKIQTAKHSGKQIGTMYQLGKLASAVGPLAGGFLAQAYGVPVVIGIAIILILISAIPLSLSPEPVRRHQKVTYKGFPWKKVKWDVISNAGLGVDQMASLFVWPLFVSIYIFSDNVYASVGLVTSIGLAASFVIARVYGRLIDSSKGRLLLTYGVIGQSFSHIIRVLINSSGAVYLFNLFNDPIQIAIRMPYTKGLYSAASSHEGFRDAYIALIMTCSNIVRGLTWVLVYFVATTASDKLALQSVFALASVTVFLTLTQKYKALR